MFGKILRLVGKVGKGAATIAGFGTAGAAVAAQVVAPSFILDQSVLDGLQLLLQIITAVGVLVGSFGFGRKAGYAAKEVE